MATADFPSFDAGELLRHRAFVRHLARELAGPGAAEDLEQDAWVAALEHPPRLAVTARSWFRTVLRHLAGRRARGERRRSAREELAAQPETVADTREVVDRLALERRMVQAVEGLREPYRSAIFLRYFEELTPPDIAQRIGVPVPTVKTRLRRGLAQLRERLEDERDPRGWAALIGSTALPTTALATKAIVVAGAIAALSGALFLLRGTQTGRDITSAAPPLAPVLDDRDEEASEPESLGLPAESQEPERLPASEPEVEASEKRAEPSAPATPGATPVEEQPRDTIALRGKVRFPDRQPVEGASVALGPWRTRTARDGGFQLELERSSLSYQTAGHNEVIQEEAALVASFPDWVPAIVPETGRLLLDAARRGHAPAPLELVLPGPSERLSGIVLDHTGSPAIGWRISLLDGTPVFFGRYRPLSAEDVASGVSQHTETPDGRFAFEGLALDRTYRIRAWNRETLEQVTSEPLVPGMHGVIVQAPMEAWRPAVDGVVVGLDGSPLEDVRCRLSMDEYRVTSGARSSSWATTGQEVQTDALGRFEFKDVPHADLFLRFHGHGGGASLPLEPEDAGRDLRIVLVRSGSFAFEAARPSAAPRTLAFLDENEATLRIEIDLGPGRTRGIKELELTDGRATGRVSEHARWLILLEDDREVARHSVLIRAGETAELRY